MQNGPNLKASDALSLETSLTLPYCLLTEEVLSE